MGYSTLNKSLEAGTSTCSTYFQPTNIRHKYVCPGSSRYSRHRRRCLFNNNNEKDDSSIVKVLPSQSKCPPLSVRRNISLLHLLFCLLIFLVILPAVRCMESQSFVEPKIGWLARTLSSVVAAVTGASIAGQPSAVEPSTNVQSTDNSIPLSLDDNSNNSSTNHPTPRKPKRRRRAIARKRKKSTYDYTATKEALGLPPSCHSQSVNAATMTQSHPSPAPLPISPSKADVKKQNKKLTSQGVRDKRKIARLEEDHCSDKTRIDIQTKKAKLQAAETKSIRQAAKKSANESLIQISFLEVSAMKAGEKIEKLEKGRNVDRNKIETLKTDKKILATQLKDEKKATRILTSQLMKDAESTMERAHAMILAAKQKEKELENAKMAATNAKTQDIQLEQ